MIALMVCGVLYIKEHLAPAPDSKLPDGNMESDDPALSEPPIVPIEPAILGEITIPDWIVQDILPVNEYSWPGIALSEVNGVVVHCTGLKLISDGHAGNRGFVRLYIQTPCLPSSIWLLLSPALDKIFLNGIARNARLCYHDGELNTAYIFHADT